jgi:hypothetical protein
MSTDSPKPATGAAGLRRRRSAPPGRPHRLASATKRWPMPKTDLQHLLPGLRGCIHVVQAGLQVWGHKQSRARSAGRRGTVNQQPGTNT